MPGAPLEAHPLHSSARVRVLGMRALGLAAVRSRPMRTSHSDRS